MNPTDAEDCLLARSVFGTDQPGMAKGMVIDWVAAQGFGRGHIDAVAFSVGAAVTVILADGSKLFVKVWPGTADVAVLAAQVQVQAVMATRGYPAPAVLTSVSALGPGWAVGMAYNQAGVLTDARQPSVRRSMAAGLARFVAEATEACLSLPGLPRRSLPQEGTTWPTPHNALFDFAATTQGAEWIDEVARQALHAMRLAGSRVVVGHHDWSAKNMRMSPDGVAVLYDWDAVFLDYETFAVGSAAAHFPVTWELDVPETPAPAAVAAFVREYEQARGVAFTPAELAEVEAGATYARAYKARCEHATDPGAVRWHGSSRQDLKDNGPFRFGRAQ